MNNSFKCSNILEMPDPRESLIVYQTAATMPNVWIETVDSIGDQTVVELSPYEAMRLGQYLLKITTPE
jgi:glutaredoxin-related protein